MNDAATACATHKQRINDLVRLKSAGGHGLSNDAVQVVMECRKLELTETELTQLSERLIRLVLSGRKGQIFFGTASLSNQIRTSKG